MLLGSGLDEDAQEKIAEKAADEGATVKALREEIRQAKAAQEAADAENERSIRALKLKLVQETGTTTEIRAALKKAEEDRDGLKHQLEATIKAYQQRMDEEAGAAYRRGLQDKAAGMEHDIRKEFQGKIDFINGERQRAEETIGELRKRLEKMEKDGRQAWDYGFEAGKKEAAEIRREVDGKRTKEIDDLQEALDASEKELESARKEADGLRRNQGDLLAAAEEAEQRAANAEAELEALRAAGPEGKEPAWKVIKMAADRFRMECEMLPILDAPGVLRGEKQIEPCLDWMETWLRVMRETLAGVVRSEGAVL
jgi:chromosome segregation ATPase